MAPRLVPKAGIMLTVRVSLSTCYSIFITGHEDHGFYFWEKVLTAEDRRELMSYGIRSRKSVVSCSFIWLTICQWMTFTPTIKPQRTPWQNRLILRSNILNHGYNSLIRCTKVFQTRSQVMRSPKQGHRLGNGFDT